MITRNNELILAELREKIASGERINISGKRLSHTYAVETEIAALAGFYVPYDEFRLRAAALLHDITKQLNPEKQLQLCDEFDIIYTCLEKLTPKTFHARTAVEVIKRDFPEFADEYILSAVRYHTTGRADMTISEKLLYLADYIEPTRKFDDCVKLRGYFYSKIGGLDEPGRMKLLNDTLILSFDMTISELIREGFPVHRDTFEARNFLIEEKNFE